MKHAVWTVLVACVSCKPDFVQAPAKAPNEAAAPADAGGLPAGHPPLGGSAVPAGPSGEIRGTLEVASAVAAQIKAGDTIFLMARSAATGGMVAVTRLQAPAAFPLPFALTASNLMIPGGSLSGEVRLSARVDKDGNASSKNPGDVVAELADVVRVPAEGIHLVFSKVL